MRRVIIVIAMFAFLVPSAEALAKGNGRPEPIQCPEDIETAIAEACPCEGQALSEESPTPWRNHGHYVRCVVRYANLLRKSECLSREARRPIKRCAARSTCGKAGRVLCCLSETGTCSDTMPDGTADGVCSNDGDLPCDTDADCTKTRARIMRNEDACLALDGEVGGEGSVCSACLAH
jgi:hypothetical protein